VSHKFVKHYEFGTGTRYQPVAVPDAQPSPPSEPEEEGVMCDCGKVTWSMWNECNDLAFICPYKRADYD
jgi:hypothetical protein